MAELKASPIVNPRMAKLAELLRKGKEFGNRVQIPESVPLLGGQGLGDMFLGEAPEEVENWGYGNYPVKIPEMSNVPQISDKRKQGVADALLAAPFAGGGGGASQAMLTAGGDPRLLLSRATYVDQLVGAAGGKSKHPSLWAQNKDSARRGMYHPSFAIRKEGVPEEFGDTLILPHPRAVDPATNPENELFNLDAYTGYPEDGTLDTRLLFEDPPERDYALRIAASPRFNSFSHYESSPFGAKSLIDPMGDTPPIYNNDAFKQLFDKLDEVDPEWYDNIQINTKPHVNLLKAHPELAHLINRVRRATGVGQEHAEVKHIGNFPVSESTVQHVFIPGNPTFGESADVDGLKRILDKRHIPWTQYNQNRMEGMSDPELIQRMLEIQKSAKFAAKLRDNPRNFDADRYDEFLKNR